MKPQSIWIIALATAQILVAYQFEQRFTDLEGKVGVIRNHMMTFPGEPTEEERLLQAAELLPPDSVILSGGEKSAETETFDWFDGSDSKIVPLEEMSIAPADTPPKLEQGHMILPGYENCTVTVTKHRFMSWTSTCGKELVTLKPGDSIPKESVPCPCGQPDCWILKVNQ